MAGRKTIDKVAVEGDSALGKSIEVPDQQQQLAVLPDQLAVVAQLQPPTLQHFPAQAASYVYEQPQARYGRHVDSPTLGSHQPTELVAPTAPVPVQVQSSSENIDPDIQNAYKSLAKVESKVNRKDVRIEELESKVEELEKKLTKETEEKAQAELQLKTVEQKQKKQESENVSKIAQLTKQLKQKEDDYEKLKTDTATQEKKIHELKQQHKKEKESLQKEINEMKKERHKEQLASLEEKHALELKVKEHELHEQKLSRELAEAREETANIMAELALERQNKAEEKERQTKEDLDKCKAERRRSSEINKEEIRRLQQQLSQMSSVSEDSNADSVG